MKDSLRLQPVRGMRDLLPETCAHYRFIVERFSVVCRRYGCEEIAPPIVESDSLFRRSLGEDSDVVAHEMYSFSDAGGQLLTLRPEGTAGIARAFNGMGQPPLPVKLFYHGPMFRRERPQKGRYRQFHQAGIEILGACEPQADVEAIACAAACLKSVGVAAELQLNTLGGEAERARWREALLRHFKSREATLSALSRERLKRNPLRILDSKEEEDQAAISAAPEMDACLSDAGRGFFAAVRAGLDSLSLPYTLNPRLVRGLDYYRHTAFEFVAQGLGAQNAVLAGGRYDGLTEKLGGAPAPSVGWAAGVERLAFLAASPPPRPRPVTVAPASDAAEVAALRLAETLRAGGWTVDLAFSGNLRKRLARAHRLHARCVCLLGEEELAGGHVTLRDFDSGRQRVVSRDALETALRALYGRRPAPTGDAVAGGDDAAAASGGDDGRAAGVAARAAVLGG